MHLYALKTPLWIPSGKNSVNGQVLIPKHRTYGFTCISVIIAPPSAWNFPGFPAPSGISDQIRRCPMQETVAAAIVRLSGWSGTTPLCDPMCGSGTLLCEAIMHARHMPAGYLRKHFGFENMPEFSQEIWEEIKTDADSKIIDLPSGLILGNDQDTRAIEATRANLAVLGIDNQVRLTRKDLRTIPDLSGTTILTNPPYGIRLGKEEELKNSTRTLATFLNSTAWTALPISIAETVNLSNPSACGPPLKKPSRAVAWTAD